MSIENNLRNIVNTRRREYFVEDTEEIFNEDVSVFTDDVVDISDIQILGIPTKILLSCSVEAERLDRPLRITNTPLVIYDQVGPADCIAHKHAIIKYNGFGKVIWEDGNLQDFFDKRMENYTLEFDDTLYQRDFVYQTHDVTCNPNGVQLMAYGGRYVYGEDIAKIYQMFFHVKSPTLNPSIMVSDKLFWDQKGVDPFIGGKTLGNVEVQITSVDKYPQNARYNLSDIVENGGIKIKLIAGEDEPVIFKSVSYNQKNKTNKLDIMFAL